LDGTEWPLVACVAFHGQCAVSGRHVPRIPWFIWRNWQALECFVQFRAERIGNGKNQEYNRDETGKPERHSPF
jgi:hypothetical protein